MAKKYSPLKTGVRGTDNCPICGKTMNKSVGVGMASGRRCVWLRCILDPVDHEVLIFLDQEKYEPVEPPVQEQK